jgi:ABC-type microcin C transport system permease subunit YejB
VAERVIAKRLGVLAEITNMIHPTQMGKRNQKSAIDASLLLYNNIQEQRKHGLVTSTVFVDVKGAFDHVFRNTLLAVLAQLGFSLSLISWLFAFLSERFLQLSFDGQMQCFRQVSHLHSSDVWILEQLYTLLH